VIQSSTLLAYRLTKAVAVTLTRHAELHFRLDRQPLIDPPWPYPRASETPCPTDGGEPELLAYQTPAQVSNSSLDRVTARPFAVRPGPSPHYTAPAAWASAEKVAESSMRSSNEKLSGALRLASNAPSVKAIESREPPGGYGSTSEAGES